MSIRLRLRMISCELVAALLAISLMHMPGNKRMLEVFLIVISMRMIVCELHGGVPLSSLPDAHECQKADAGGLPAGHLDAHRLRAGGVPLSSLPEAHACRQADAGSFPGSHTDVHDRLRAGGIHLSSLPDAHACPQAEAGGVPDRHLDAHDRLRAGGGPLGSLPDAHACQQADPGGLPVSHLSEKPIYGSPARVVRERASKTVPADMVPQRSPILFFFFAWLQATALNMVHQRASRSKFTHFGKQTSGPGAPGNHIWGLPNLDAHRDAHACPQAEAGGVPDGHLDAHDRRRAGGGPLSSLPDARACHQADPGGLPVGHLNAHRLRAGGVPLSSLPDAHQCRQVHAGIFPGSHTDAHVCELVAFLLAVLMHVRVHKRMLEVFLIVISMYMIVCELTLLAFPLMHMRVNK